MKRYFFALLFVFNFLPLQAEAVLSYSCRDSSPCSLQDAGRSWCDWGYGAGSGLQFGAVGGPPNYSVPLSCEENNQGRPGSFIFLLNLGAVEFATCPTGTTANATTGLCEMSQASNCVAGRRHLMDTTFGGAATICTDGCAVTMSSAPITFNGSSQATFIETGAACGSTTANAPATDVPAPVLNSPCTKTTKLNGGIEYDCGQSTSTGSATGVHCEQTASGYTCTGGDSNTTCWTDDTGTINCTGKGATEEGTATTTPTRTERSTKSDTTTGTRTETKTEYLPGGGWTTTTSTYDAAGNKTGETKESGSGLGGAKDGNGNEQGGGDANGTSEPPAEPPSGALPRSNITLPGFQSSSFLGGSAGCPAPALFAAFGGTYAVSFEPGCQAAGMLRAVMIAFALFLAVRIFQGYVTEAVR